MRVLLTGGNPFLQVALASTLAARGHEVDLDRRTGDERPSGDGARTDPPGASPDPDVVVVIDRSVAGHGRSTLRWGIADDAGERGLRAARAARRVVHVESRRAASPDGMPDWLSTARGAVTTIRTSLVYGTGIDPVTQLLIMMRSLPVVPLPPGRHTLRPLWRGDLERIVAAVVERSGRAERIEVTGPEVVGWRQLAEALGGLIDRDPVRVALPVSFAASGARLLARFDRRYAAATSPLAVEQTEGAGDDARADVPQTITGTASVGVSEGLRHLVAELPEITPAEGTGAIEVKLFGAVIADARLEPERLIDRLRARFADVMPIPIGVEPVLPAKQLQLDTSMSMHVPGRGHVQVRVVDAGPRHVMLATARGHVVAGIVRFRARTAGDGVRFEVLVCDAAANPVDWLALGAGGSLLQHANWSRVVRNVVALTEGHRVRLYHGQRRLEGAEAVRIQRGIARTVEASRRRRSGRG